MDFPPPLLVAFKDAVTSGTVTRTWSDEDGNHIQFHGDPAAFSRISTEAEAVIEHLRISGQLEDSLEVVISTWYPGKPRSA